MASLETVRRRGQSKPRKLSVSAPVRAITVDDVIGDLLELFKQIGSDPSTIANRVRHLGSMPTSEVRTYDHSVAIGDLLTFWHQDPDFTDEAGNPVPLKVKGRIRSFSGLARRSLPKLDPTKLLTELQELGAVSISSSGHVHLLKRSLNVYEDKELARAYTLSTLRWFIKTLRHNLESTPSNTDQLFNRVAWNGAFPKKEIPKLKLWLSKHGQSLLLSADNWMMNKSRYGKNARGSRKSTQIAVGLYMAVDGA